MSEKTIMNKLLLAFIRQRKTFWFGCQNYFIALSCSSHLDENKTNGSYSSLNNIEIPLT